VRDGFINFDSVNLPLSTPSSPALEAAKHEEPPLADHAGKICNDSLVFKAKKVRIS
jgi:hypothetical protein